MTDPKITVAIPVGPMQREALYLEECLASVRAQTYAPDEILVVDDMARLPVMGDGIDVWRSPWRLGVATAFNFGVALAANDLVFLLGDDDRLEPTCLEECLASYEAHARQDGYYWVVIHYSGEQGGEWKEGGFNTPCNAAMVTKGFWRATGGFPVDATLSPDFAFMQVCGRLGFGEHIISVADRPLYHLRIHDKTETARSMPARKATEEAPIEPRNLSTLMAEYCVRVWVPPAKWGRKG